MLRAVTVGTGGIVDAGAVVTKTCRTWPSWPVPTKFLRKREGAEDAGSAGQEPNSKGDDDE